MVQRARIICCGLESRWKWFQEGSRWRTPILGSKHIRRHFDSLFSMGEIFRQQRRYALESTFCLPCRYGQAVSYLNRSHGILQIDMSNQQSHISVRLYATSVPVQPGSELKFCPFLQYTMILHVDGQLMKRLRTWEGELNTPSKSYNSLRDGCLIPTLLTTRKGRWDRFRPKRERTSEKRAGLCWSCAIYVGRRSLRHENCDVDMSS